MRRALALVACAAILWIVRVESGGSSPTAIRAAVVATPDSPEARGRLVYEHYGCGLCHGADAKGGFANPNAETDGKVPGLILVAEGYSSSELRKQILDGAPNIGLADPKGPRPPYRMPGWRGRMTDQEVGDLVKYLISLRPKSATSKWH